MISSSGMACSLRAGSLRHDNWTFFGVAMAQIVSLLFVLPALTILAWRHRHGHPVDDPPSLPRCGDLGARGRPVEPGYEPGDQPQLDAAVS